MYVTRRLSSLLVLLNAEAHPIMDGYTWQEIANRLVLPHSREAQYAEFAELEQYLTGLIEAYGRAYYMLHEYGEDHSGQDVSSVRDGWWQCVRGYAHALGLIEETLREVEKVVSRGRR